MSHRMAIVVVAVAVAAAAPARGATTGAGALTRVYADSSGALHVVSSSGEDRRVGGKLRYDAAKLASDGHTYGALVRDSIDTDPPNHDMADVAQKLVVWRDGRRLRAFVPGDFIRAWGFWKGGTQIALYSGGLHFAGHYELIDLATGNSLAGGEDPVTDQSPDWMRSLEP
jgi:hypothetical protein